MVDLSEVNETADDGGSGSVVRFPGAAVDPERSLAQRQIQGLVEQAIDGLPEAFRTVLVARVVEGLSVEETATLLELKPETVKTRLHRARRQLRASLQGTLAATMNEAFPFMGVRCARVADAVMARLDAEQTA
jgi:RNA polymerase sigma factor (sigma-70 family)